jgi:hypothetical protein
MTRQCPRSRCPWRTSQSERSRAPPAAACRPTLDVAGDSGIAIPIPSTAYVSGLIDQPHAARAQFTQPGPGQQSTEARADQRDVDVVVDRLAAETGVRPWIFRELGESTPSSRRIARRHRSATGADVPGRISYAGRPVRSSPAHRGLDFQDGRHDHRLTPVGLAHPFADGAAHRLSDPERIGDLLGRK